MANTVDVPQSVIDYVSNNNITNEILRVQDNNDNTIFKTYFVDSNGNISLIGTSDNTTSSVTNLKDLSDVAITTTDYTNNRRYKMVIDGGDSNNKFKLVPDNSLLSDLEFYPNIDGDYLNMTKFYEDIFIPSFNNSSNFGGLYLNTINPKLHPTFRGLSNIYNSLYDYGQVLSIVTKQNSYNDMTFTNIAPLEPNISGDISYMYEYNLKSEESDTLYNGQTFSMRDHKPRLLIQSGYRESSTSYNTKNSDTNWHEIVVKDEPLPFNPPYKLATKDDLLTYFSDSNNTNKLDPLNDSELLDSNFPIRFKYDYKILDGGNDKYDSGNKIFIKRANSNYLEPVNLNGGYRLFGHIYCLIYAFRDIQYLKIDGNNGADGSGDVVVADNVDRYTTPDNYTLTLSYKYTHNTGDPGIHHYIYYPVKNLSDVTDSYLSAHNYSTNTDDDTDEYIFNTPVNVIYMVFWSSNDNYGNNAIAFNFLPSHINFN